MSRVLVLASCLLPFLLLVLSVRGVHKHAAGDLYLLIDAEQVKKFGGYRLGNIYVIDKGYIQEDLMHPNFEKFLPTIPSEVSQVDFTWSSGKKRYYYKFDLRTLDETVLDTPKISIKSKGKIPKEPTVFSVILPCSNNRTGVGSFEVGLMIEMRRGKTRQALIGTPIRLKLRKYCSPKGVFPTGPDPECDKMCAHGGRCNSERVCECTDGYMGQYCRTALCYPDCLNGGNCTAPGVCSCPPGYQGNHCEGGLCTEKCLNGGKCVQKDKCECQKGFFGTRCEMTKCMVPCLNGGKCKGTNKCRCPAGYQGDHCEIGGRSKDRSVCRKPCKHGSCQSDHTCLCEPGWSGRFCQHKMLSKRWKDGT